MIDISFTMVIQWINFLILVFLLYKLLFKPVTRFLEERQKKISDSLRDAVEKKETAGKVLQDYEDKLSGIHSEAIGIMERAKKEAYTAHGKIVADANMEAKVVLERAQDDAKRQAEKASLELRGELADLIVSGASRVLERKVTRDDNRKIIDKFVKDLSKEKEEKRET